MYWPSVRSRPQCPHGNPFKVTYMYVYVCLAAWPASVSTHLRRGVHIVASGEPCDGRGGLWLACADVLCRFGQGWLRLALFVCLITSSQGNWDDPPIL